MLQFTSSGAVKSPTTLQIRVTQAFPGRVIAGAPVPGRSMTDEEVRANLRHFTVERTGPRTRPCTALVLSGVSLNERPALADLVAEARDWGLERCTVHLRPSDAACFGERFAARVDAVAMTVANAQDVSALGHLQGVFRTAVVVLTQDALSQLTPLANALAEAKPERVVWTWPLPPSSPPPHAQQVLPALLGPVRTLAASGVATGIKGLPPCALGELRDLVWRSGNRWYVDAAHQTQDALLFFPSVVRFSKADECRYCKADGECDGVPDPWLRQGLAGPLAPL